MATQLLSKITDEQLVQLQLGSGKTRYFEELYRRYFSKIYYQTISYVKEAEEAEDVTQDIFVKLYDRLAKFQGKSSFSTWIFAFSRNAVLDHLRRKGKLQQQRLEESAVEDVPEVEDNELLQIRVDQLSKILDLLHPDEKAVLIMMYAHEWQMDEIAAHMGIGLSAIKMRIKRAKAKVKQLHAEHFGST